MSIFGFKIENGWILSVIFLAVSYLPMMFSSRGAKRLVNFSWMSKRGNFIAVLLFVLYFGMMIYTLFLPIQFNSLLFYFGLGVFALGLLGSVISLVNYFTTSLDQVISKGIYQISRNPVYVTMAVCWLGIAIMLDSMIIAVATVVYMVLTHWVVLEEEDYCQKTFGDDYLEYKNSVPRYLLINSQKSLSAIDHAEAKHGCCANCTSGNGGCGCKKNS
jgi:protein-S-isoprenylcysteine O-methyltransferase Ste14